jgi:hypothetical protein
MTHPKRDFFFAVVSVLVGSAMMWLATETKPQRCFGAVQELFWNCARQSSRCHARLNLSPGFYAHGLAA